MKRGRKWKEGKGLQIILKREILWHRSLAKRKVHKETRVDLAPFADPGFWGEPEYEDRVTSADREAAWTCCVYGEAGEVTEAEFAAKEGETDRRVKKKTMMYTAPGISPEFPADNDGCRFLGSRPDLNKADCFNQPGSRPEVSGFLSER